MSPHRVEVREPSGTTRAIDVVGGLDLGRECDGIVVSDERVSRLHLRLTSNGDRLTVDDLGSTNGTRVNGARVSEQTVLYSGDTVVAGGTELTVINGTAMTTTTGDVAPPPMPVGDVVPPPMPEDDVTPTPALADDVVPTPAWPPDDVVPTPALADDVVPTPARPPDDVVQTPARPDDVAPTPEKAAGPAPRAVLDELQALRTDTAVIRYRPGTAGERMAKAVAAAAKRARERLAGLGSEPWGLRPEICLTDPYPDPDRAGTVITQGTTVDAERGEIWIVATPEVPLEPMERPLALLFGAVLPAAEDLALLLEGYGLYVAGSPDPDPQLRGISLPPLATAEGELRTAMALSFVRYVIERADEADFRRLLSSALPGHAEDAARQIYGSGLAGLEEAWRTRIVAGPPHVRTGQFLRLIRRYLRPHVRREAEMFVYMLLGLVFTVVMPFVTKRLFDTAIPSGRFSEVGTLLVVLAVAFAVSLLAGLRRTYLSAYVSSSVVRDVRAQMFDRLQSLSSGWFLRHEQGDILSRLFSDVMLLEAGLSQTLREGVFQILSLIVAAVVLITLNPFLAVVVLLGTPLVGAVYRLMAKGALARSTAVQEQTGSVLSVATENYAAQPVVKAFGLERHERKRFETASQRLFEKEVRLQLFGGLFGLSVQMIVTALRLVVLGLGAWLILEGRLTVGGFVAFLGIMGEVIAPVTVLTGIGQQLQEATGALVRINEILDSVPEIADASDATELPPLADEVRLTGVGFSYTPERVTLQGIDVRVAAGSRVVFVGPSGAGKSSVLQLLMRFYDPDEGAVLFDGKDVRNGTLASLRGQLGVVFQETFLFSGTVRENIALGNPQATDDEIEAAARAAELHDHVMSLPQRYDTPVGERGGRLSGGQRQRLAIARALVRNPCILILDEATSALDPRTERLIAATLEKVGRGRTTIAVTHRLTSVTDYDQIFVIDAGRIVDHGTHDELVSREGVYAALWAEQVGGHAPSEAPFDAAAALAGVPLFEDLDGEQLAAAAARFEALALGPGETIAEGGGRLVLVRRGRARTLVPGLDGELVAGADLGPGDCFGLAALLGGETGAVLQAVDAVTVLVLGDEALAGLAATIPSVAVALEGLRPRAAVPAGGQRLSRLSMAAVLPRSAGGARAAITPNDVRRASGTFPAVNP